MLQHSEIKERFGRNERDITEAARTCRSDSKLPQSLRDCVMQLEQQTQKAKPILESQDEKQITRCVDDLEETGGRAEVALKGVPGVDTKLSNAVLHAHSELTELKMKLH
ncbi:MAG: hypothetical protein QOI59_875 [Gammaproteobacteria bacterium]|nr:hypothetical protein [Gammaproteobacteria bacterium]